MFCAMLNISITIVYTRVKIKLLERKYAGRIRRRVSIDVLANSKCRVNFIGFHLNFSARIRSDNLSATCLLHENVLVKPYISFIMSSLSFHLLF